MNIQLKVQQPEYLNDFGRWWLSGPKYDASRVLAGDDWLVPAHKALEAHGVSLAGLQTIHDVVRAFKGRWFWKPDPLFQVGDIVLPPKRLLEAGGDDCDGWAMMHAQAIQYALGYRTYIVSYLADPFVLSHHFCAVLTPGQEILAVQPQPTAHQDPDIDPLLPTNFPSFKAAAETVLSLYQPDARIVWADVRDLQYNQVAFTW